MANVDYNTKIKSIPFGNLLKTGDLGGSLSFNSASPAAAVQDDDPIGKAFASAKRYGITLDPGTLNILAAGSAFQGPKPPGYNDPGGLREQLYDLNRLQQEQADYRQKLGKESTAEAFKYKMFQQGLDKLGNAFNPYGSKEGALAYAAHLSSIPGNVSEQMRSMNIQPPAAMSYNAPQRQYFT
jgi:hypothetical protein